MRILSVDDSAVARRFIKDAVDVLGFEFLEAENGKEGLEVLEKENGKVDLILLDWNMPEMDGMEMLREMKADDRFREIPVTMVTTEVLRPKVVEGAAV